MVFHDEFNADTLDLNKWDYRKLGKRNDAFNVKDAVSFKDGNLVIKVYSKKTKTIPIPTIHLRYQHTKSLTTPTDIMKQELNLAQYQLAGGLFGYRPPHLILLDLTQNRQV